MVRAPINKKRYVVAFILTSIIFALGLLIGYGITGIRLNYTTEMEKEQRLAYDSLQVQTLYLANLLNKEDCPALINTLEKNVDDAETTAQKLEGFIKDTGSTEDYTILKRQYALAQIRYWLLAQEVNKVCKKDSVIILFFYSVEPVCDDCTTQGVILTYLKAVLKDKLLVFSFDAFFDDEPLVSLLKANYNITMTPTVVIDDTAYEGLINKDSLLSIICAHYADKPEVCL